MRTSSANEVSRSQTRKRLIAIERNKLQRHNKNENLLAHLAIVYSRTQRGERFSTQQRYSDLFQLLLELAKEATQALLPFLLFGTPPSLSPSSSPSVCG